MMLRCAVAILVLTSVSALTLGTRDATSRSSASSVRTATVGADSLLMSSDTRTLDDALNRKWLNEAMNGDLEVVTELLDSGNVDIDWQDDSGHTALMLAVAYKHVEVVRLLEARGADVEKKNAVGFTAMMMAQWGDDPNVVALMTIAMIRPWMRKVSGERRVCHCSADRCGHVQRGICKVNGDCEGGGQCTAHIGEFGFCQPEKKRKWNVNDAQKLVDAGIAMGKLYPLCSSRRGTRTTLHNNGWTGSTMSGKLSDDERTEAKDMLDRIECTNLPAGYVCKKDIPAHEGAPAKSECASKTCKWHAQLKVWHDSNYRCAEAS